MVTFLGLRASSSNICDAIKLYSSVNPCRYVIDGDKLVYCQEFLRSVGAPSSVEQIIDAIHSSLSSSNKAVITIARLDGVSTNVVYCLTVSLDGGETTPLLAVLNSTGKYQLATSTVCCKTMGGSVVTLFFLLMLLSRQLICFFVELCIYWHTGTLGRYTFELAIAGPSSTLFSIIYS